MELKKLDGSVIGTGDSARKIAENKKPNLNEANLRWANLRWANLRWANLRGADIRGANLRWANLSEANLSEANLNEANLREANLSEANLNEANLHGADLREADLRGAKLPHFQIAMGDLDVWKKVDSYLVRLRIPHYARRTGSLVGRKCRAEFADVVWIQSGNHKVVISDGQGCGVKTTYRVGQRVYSDMYDDDPRVECSHGIHFFLTRQEAEEF